MNSHSLALPETNSALLAEIAILKADREALLTDCPIAFERLQFLSRVHTLLAVMTYAEIQALDEVILLEVVNHASVITKVRWLAKELGAVSPALQVITMQLLERQLLKEHKMSE